MCKSWNDIIQQDKCARSKRRTHLSEVDAGREVRFMLLAEWTSFPGECSASELLCLSQGELITSQRQKPGSRF